MPDYRYAVTAIIRGVETLPAESATTITNCKAVAEFPLIVTRQDHPNTPKHLSLIHISEPTRPY